MNDPVPLPDALLQFLRGEEARAVDTRLDEARKVAIDFYNGALFGDEQDGRSQLVTRDVAEVIDYMTVSILRTMVSGERVVEFEAQTPDQVEMADAATELVAWQFMRAQPGYRILHDWLKAGLLEKSGIVKTWAEIPHSVAEHVIPAEMLADSGAHAAEPVDDADPAGDWRVRTHETQPALFRDMAVPNEEFRVAPDARTLDDAVYVAHVTRRSIAELTAMGFDFDPDTLWGDNAESRVIEQARDADRTGQPADVYRTGAGRAVWLREEYVRYDIDGDGMAERLCIHRVGQTVLDCVPVDDQPFVLWSPFPMPHRLIGQSLADKVMDVQRTRSVMLRQAMDNLYLSNAPRVMVDEGSITENTVDDLLTVQPGAVVRYRGGNPPAPLVTPFVADTAFKAMEIMAGERESRTGITRLNQGLDADTLNKTATGTALMQAQGQQIEEYLARNFAESVADLFEKKLRLMVKFGSVTTVQIDGTGRKVDPTAIDATMRVKVRVGLGSGRKDQRLSLRTQLLEWQKEALIAGEPIVDLQHLYNNLKGIVADGGMGNINQYFIDPATLADPATGQMPARPDPAGAKVQAEANLAAQKLAGEQAHAQAVAVNRAREIELEHVANLAKVSGDMGLKQQQFDHQAGLERAKADAQAALAQQQSDREFTLRLEAIHAKAHLDAAATAMPRDRPGGALDA